MSLLTAWVIYTIAGVAAFSVVFVWAVRSRQFTELDRQRYIALRVDEPSETARTRRVPNRIDRYTWVALLALSIAAMATAIVMGLRGG